MFSSLPHRPLTFDSVSTVYARADCFVVVQNFFWMAHITVVCGIISIIWLCLRLFYLYGNFIRFGCDQQSRSEFEVIFILALCGHNVREQLPNWKLKKMKNAAYIHRVTSNRRLANREKLEVVISMLLFLLFWWCAKKIAFRKRRDTRYVSIDAYIIPNGYELIRCEILVFSLLVSFHSIWDIF